MRYLLLLLGRPICPDIILIVGRWCSTPCIEDKETLDSVPKLVIYRYLYSYVLSTPRGLFYFPLSLSSSVATAPYCSTARPITTCSRHRIPNQSPAALSDP